MEGAGRKGKEETEKVCEKRTGERKAERKTKGKEQGEERGICLKNFVLVSKGTICG